MAQKQTCSRCNYYDAYYRKSYSNFYKQNCGWCSMVVNIVDKCGTCEKWRAKGKISKLRKTIAIKKLDEAIENINIIKQILNEEKDEF